MGKVSKAAWEFNDQLTLAISEKPIIKPTCKKCGSKNTIFALCKDCGHDNLY